VRPVENVEGGSEQFRLAAAEVSPESFEYLHVRCGEADTHRGPVDDLGIGFSVTTGDFQGLHVVRLEDAKLALESSAAATAAAVSVLTV
jgi:hypothetical protein